MLQKHYGKTIVGMYLVVLHPNQKDIAYLLVLLLLDRALFRYYP